MEGRLILIMGDQLSEELAVLRGADPARDVIMMAEVAEEATPVPHHPQKIALVFAAMRKFAARLGDLGVDHLYYEETAGGHSNDADPVANARRWARHYVYLAQQLMD